MSLEVILWLTFTPITLIMVILAIVSVRHYQGDYYSCDVYIISILCSVMLQMIVAIPVQCNALEGKAWTPSWCSALFWLNTSLRAIELMSVCWICLDRTFLLRKRDVLVDNFGNSSTIKFIVVLTWLFPAILTLIPIYGLDKTLYPSVGRCQFLPHELEPSFAGFIVIVEIALFFVCVICAVDAMISFKRLLVKRLFRASAYSPDTSASQITLLSNHSGGPETSRTPVSYQPNRAAGLSGEQGRKDRLKYQLQVEVLNSTLVLCIALATYCTKFFPADILLVITMIYKLEPWTVQATYLWFLHAEALVVSHILWMASSRYRKAYKVVVFKCDFRTSKALEDERMVRLQSVFRRGTMSHGAGASVTSSNTENADVRSESTLGRNTRPHRYKKRYEQKLTNISLDPVPPEPRKEPWWKTALAQSNKYELSSFGRTPYGAKSHRQYGPSKPQGDDRSDAYFYMQEVPSISKGTPMLARASQGGPSTSNDTSSSSTAFAGRRDNEGRYVVDPSSSGFTGYMSSDYHHDCLTQDWSLKRQNRHSTLEPLAECETISLDDSDDVQVEPPAKTPQVSQTSSNFDKKGSLSQIKKTTRPMRSPIMPTNIKSLRDFRKQFQEDNSSSGRDSDSVDAIPNGGVMTNGSTPVDYDNVRHKSVVQIENRKLNSSFNNNNPTKNASHSVRSGANNLSKNPVPAPRKLSSKKAGTKKPPDQKNGRESHPKYVTVISIV
ncbi:uncharacterized protein LOC106174418 [Lingula anatina]|uniref:Uncharacterized protein LOC106174418 n=1 Tax=Lingula anatina TaxID=7574 RepID=A0A1S3JLZ1_LINAN|nr:uncharacterized protein LOC106174418 [Lingula anatina]|eukprot:XP_013411430.1 uncharacterized protein LOC106174418 [Lingula anatina]